MLTCTIFSLRAAAQPFAQSYEFISSTALEEQAIKQPQGLSGFSSKPAFHARIQYTALKDSVGYYGGFDTTDNKYERHLMRSDLLVVRARDFRMAINPLLYLQPAIMRRKVSRNSRGFRLYGNIGKKFAFESQFMENQVFVMNYLYDFIKANEVYPGHGRTKPFKTNGFDFAMSSGSVTWQPFSFLTLQAGHGKHFFGNGYRSLLLSDNAFNYPFVKAQWAHKYFTYEVVTASLMNIAGGRLATSIYSEPTFRKKTASFQYLTFHPVPRLEVGLFNGIIWRATSPAHPFFDFAILNPLPFFNVASNGFSSPNNAVAGINLSYSLKKKYLFYGQYVLDEWGKKGSNSFAKSGWQAGVKIFRAFGLPHCVVTLERNYVSPYTYTTADAQQNYVHYNQGLAHPAGANFQENVVIVQYRYNNFFLNGKFTFQLSGKDSTGYVSGNNVLLSDQNARLRSTSFLNGSQTHTNTLLFEGGYILNPAWQFQVFVSHFTYLTEKADVRKSQTLFSVGLRTAVFNQYTDF